MALFFAQAGPALAEPAEAEPLNPEVPTLEPDLYHCAEIEPKNELEPPPPLWQLEGTAPPPAELTEAQELQTAPCPPGEIAYPEQVEGPPPIPPGVHGSTAGAAQTLDDPLSLGPSALTQPLSAAPIAPEPPGRSVTGNTNYYYVAGEWGNVASVGGNIEIAIGDPEVNLGGSHTLGQLAYMSGPEGLRTVELGWDVDPSTFGDGLPHLFTYANKDQYASNGQYGGDAYDQYFVPLSGASYSVGQSLVSLTGNPSATYQFAVMYMNGNWWVWFANEWIGYLTGSFWNGEFTSPSWHEYYGEVFDSHGVTTDMGDGQYGTSLSAILMRRPLRYPNTHEVHEEELPAGNPYASNPSLYSAGNVSGDRRSWRFGGPGNGPTNPPPEAFTGGPSGINPHGAALSGTVSPNGQVTFYHFDYGPTTGYGSTTFSESAGSSWQPQAAGATLTGLNPVTQYHYRLVAGNGGGTSYGVDFSFTTPPAPPLVTTKPAQKVTMSKATVAGLVNPENSPTSYYFQYGETSGYGLQTPTHELGASLSWSEVTGELTGLNVGTTYHYRLVASNAGGTTYGADGEFKTPNKPVVTAEAASYVNTLEPTMDATIAPERADTHYQFEYGKTESYGTTVPVPAEDIGAGAPVMVERGLKGLARSTTYHYRVTAENEVGVVHGADRSFTTLPPCKGAEQKCVWSLQEPSNPLPPSKFEMKGVSCSSATLCVAVGKNLYNNRSFVDRWNGSAWSLLSGAVPGEMRHVTCVGSGCFAVGVSGAAATSWTVSEYPVGGGSWIVAPITTPTPAGSSETVLDGVSCTAEAACTAVGSYKGSEGTYHPLVERWGGSAWSLQSAPNPAEGTAQNAMLGVSCISIGCITVGEAAGKPVAETWVGGTWALSSPKLPAGAKGGKLSSVSCTNTSCIATGDSNEGLGTEKPLAESFVSLVWSVQGAPAPAGSKGFAELASLSCASESACTATGWYATAVSGGQPTELKTLAETWNGSSWTIQSSANSGQRFNALADVSCSAAGACTAVGADSEASGVEPESLAERWNGSTWSTQKLVNPEEPLEDEMKAVSCSTNTICVGAGKNLFAENGFAEVWNGTEWMVVASVAGEMRKISCAGEGCFMVGAAGGSAKISLVLRLGGVWGIQAMSVPLPAGAGESVLDGVSCGSESACTAVGSYKGSEGTYHPLVERWNGSAWSLQSAPNPAEGTAQNAMLGVSCGGAYSCMAVGEAAGRPVAETWNGSAWSPSSAPPLPAGAKGATLPGVSCGSAKVCMAVGDSYEGTGTEKALAERWSGGAWSIVPAPAPAGAKGFVDLTDVACLSPNACFSAGYYAPELVGGVPASLKTLVESWEGTEWSVLTTPNLASQTFNSLAGISCSTSIDCTAVGGATSSLSKRPPVQLAMRFE